MSILDRWRTGFRALVTPVPVTPPADPEQSATPPGTLKSVITAPLPVTLAPEESSPEAAPRTVRPTAGPAEDHVVSTDQRTFLPEPQDVPAGDGVAAGSGRASAATGDADSQPPVSVSPVLPQTAPPSVPGPGENPGPTMSRENDVRTALRLFERDEPIAARQWLEEAALAGPIGVEGRELLDLLLPDPAPLPVIDAVLRFCDGRLSVLERTRWLARRFDSVPPTDEAAPGAALDLLAAATMAGEPGWSLVQASARRARLDAALAGPEAQIDLLEQEALAPPETGLPDTVPGRTLAFGRSMAARGELQAVRDAERLLHLLRQPELAYLLEADRKLRSVDSRRRRNGPRPAGPSPARLVVVIAGGHPPLRRMARRELDELDLADVREFPSAWEGNRQGRHARETIDGSDLAVVVWRQIAHSTSDQVFAAARALSVPVVKADTPTISAIRRAITDFQVARQ